MTEDVRASYHANAGPQLERLRRDDPVAYENVVATAAETSELAAYRDATDHSHVVARTPKGR